MPPNSKPIVLRLALLLLLIVIVYAQANGLDRALANMIRGNSAAPGARSVVTGQPPVFGAPRPSPTAATAAPVLNSGQPTAPPAGVRLANGQCVVPNGWVPYTIEAGEILAVIAESKRLTADQLAAANCIDNADLIFVGQIIAVPAN